MDTSSHDIEHNEEIAEVQKTVLDAFQKPFFAVLDGAQFNDIESELGDVDISPRSLFRREGDPAWRRDGPWLVELANDRIRAYIEALSLEKSCAVFWSCAKGGQALWQHLRTINFILVPDDRIYGNNGIDGRQVKYERVMFRHWDPNVLGSVMPSLTPEQFARFFGPASAIFMNASAFGGLKRALKPTSFPAAPRGLLKLTPENLRSAEAIRFQGSCQSYMDYLRSVAPDHTSTLSENDLRQITIDYLEGARLYGVSSRASLGRWCYLQLVSGGKFAESQEVRALMSSKQIKISADDRVNRLMKMLPAKLREMA